MAPQDLLDAGAVSPAYFETQPAKSHKFSRRTRVGLVIGSSVLLWLGLASAVQAVLS